MACDGGLELIVAGIEVRREANSRRRGDNRKGYRGPSGSWRSRSHVRRRWPPYPRAWSGSRGVVQRNPGPSASSTSRVVWRSDFSRMAGTPIRPMISRAGPRRVKRRDVGRAMKKPPGVIAPGQRGSNAKGCWWAIQPVRRGPETVAELGDRPRERPRPGRRRATSGSRRCRRRRPAPARPRGSFPRIDSRRSTVSAPTLRALAAIASTS